MERNSSSGNTAYASPSPSAPAASSKKPSVVATATNTAAAGGSPAVAEPAQEEMEAALIAAIPVTPDDLRALVLARVRAVQAALVNSGKVEGERVSLRSPQPISPDAHGQPRANLALQ